jgi:hypothetical protein
MIDMSCTSFVEETTKLMNKKLNFQRWFYSLIGLMTISVIILLTLGQIRDMKKENQEFAIYLLLLIHSSLFIFYTKYLFLFFPISLCPHFSSFNSYFLS